MLCYVVCSLLIILRQYTRTHRVVTRHDIATLCMRYRLFLLTTAHCSNGLESIKSCFVFSCLYYHFAAFILMTMIAFAVAFDRSLYFVTFTGLFCLSFG
jgi:hypothetical protein